MATVKITELPEVTTLNSNTSNTLLVGVNLASGVTGKYTAATLANGLYSHNPLNVGNNTILFPDTIGQFSGTSNDYLQINLQNVDGDGSADFVITANNGTDTSRYLDVGLNGSLFSDPDYSSMSAYDGYLYVHGTSHSSSDGNLIIGTASSGASIRIIAGGLESSNVVGTITKNNIDLKNDLIVRGNVQITNTSNFILPDSSFAASNTFVRANDAVTLASAKSYTDTANSFIQTRYLANTSNALFNGTLNIGDKLNVNGSVIFANTQFSNTQAALTIAACPIGDIQLPSNDGYMLHISGKQNVSSRIVFDSFGGNTYAVIAGRTARGTPTAPQAVANNDVLMRVSGNGFGTTKYSTLGSGRIDIVATENFTDSARATQIQFYTTAVGSNIQTQIASFNGVSAVFNGVVSPQKGFIYTPNVVSSNVTTYDIDIANNSLYKLSCNNNLSLSLSNFQSGKVIEVWLTNLSGSTRTITHGCVAINTTINSTTFTMPSSSSAYLRYFSVDGDLANTFVSIDHS